MAIDLTREKAKNRAVGTTEKPSRVEKIRSALTEIEETGVMPDCVTATPGAFLWEFYKAWVENGGRDGGKNRNSIRRMRDVWLTGEHDVKSLHPKLTGRVRVGRDDARALMSLFLRRWTFVGVKDGDWILTADGYAPFPCRDCRKLCDQLLDAMYADGSEQADAGLLLPARVGVDELTSASDDWNEIAKLYGDLDALITLSRHNSAVGPTPWDTIRLFWHYMNYLYETIGDNDTIFIWIIDIGVRQVEDESAWKDFLNFEMMKTKFRAFASFDSESDPHDDVEGERRDSSTAARSGIHDAFLRSITIPEEGHREKRWKWLCERCVIVIQNLRMEEFEHLYEDEDQQAGKFRLRDIGVTAENILPSMVPPIWAQNRELRELYGRDLKEISDATLTVHYHHDVSNLEHDDPDCVRYFAHAPNRSRTDETTYDTAARSKKLESPGEHYDEAMHLVYWAARHRLKKIRGDRDDSDQHQWQIAVAYLRNQGFRVIRLQEFMRIHRSPGDQAGSR